MPLIKKETIKVEIVGVDFKVVERYKKNIQLLLCQGVFDIGPGKATLHFDKDKILRKIEIDEVKWKGA